MSSLAEKLRTYKIAKVFLASSSESKANGVDKVINQGTALLPINSFDPENIQPELEDNDPTKVAADKNRLIRKKLEATGSDKEALVVSIDVVTSYAQTQEHLELGLTYPLHRQKRKFQELLPQEQPVRDTQVMARLESLIGNEQPNYLFMYCMTNFIIQWHVGITASIGEIEESTSFKVQAHFNKLPAAIIFDAFERPTNNKEDVVKLIDQIPFLNKGPGLDFANLASAFAYQAFLTNHEGEDIKLITNHLDWIYDPDIFHALVVECQFPPQLIHNLLGKIDTADQFERDEVRHMV
ncbi:MAG TPA: hypothetical protein VD999_00850 [Vitreimonas sp.]|nr:hypothetical protein [Vitreimonas sp.]